MKWNHSILFVRRNNRLVGLTPAGQALLPLIDRALHRFDDLRRVALRFVELVAPEPGRKLKKNQIGL